MSQHALGRPDHRGPAGRRWVRVLRYVIAVYLGAAAIGGLLAGDWIAAMLVGVSAVLVWPSAGVLPWLDSRGGGHRG